MFGRVSKGGRANADRLLFGPNVLPDGSLLDESAAVDEVKQIETGVKYKGDNYTLYVTGFLPKPRSKIMKLPRKNSLTANMKPAA